MWSATENGGCSYFSLFFQNLCLFLSLQIFCAWAQCQYGLESSCIWMHEPNTNLLWQKKSDADGIYVELTKCVKPCGIATIQTLWLPARDQVVTATLKYKIYGTSKVYLRLNMELDDTLTPRQLFSKASSYAQGYPDSWTSQDVTIPATHTKYKLLLKAFLPYSDAMIAVKDINLDATYTAPSTSTTSTTPKTTSTTTKSSNIEKEEILPTQYIPEIKEYITNIAETWSDSEIFPDVDDDDSDESRSRFQALEVEDVVTEEDLMTGCTTVVEPQICTYK